MSDTPRARGLYARDLAPGATVLHPGGWRYIVLDTRRTGENRIKMTVACVGLKGKSLIVTVKPNDVFVEDTFLIQESPL